MTSKHTNSALRALAMMAALFCLAGAPAAYAQNTQTTTQITTTTTEVTQGGSDIMPVMGIGAGTSTATAKEYIVAPGEETHPPVRLTPDSTEMIKLDEDANSIIIGNPAHVNIMLNNPRTLLLAPRQPGASRFTILNADGKVIMQRHVIVSGPKENYVRVRRSCINGGGGCQPTTVYYCPDICHDVRLGAGQGNAAPSGVIPSSGSIDSGTAGNEESSAGDGGNGGDDNEPPMPSDEGGASDSDDSDTSSEDSSE